MEPTDSQHEPLAYLTERFRNDADTLRKRAAAPASVGPSRGPDAAASNRMADACDDVIARLRRAGDPDEAMLRHLTGVAEELAREAAAERDPWVRSVYGGAATRIADVVARTRAAWQDDAGDEQHDESDVDDETDDDPEHESGEELLDDDAEEDA